MADFTQLRTMISTTAEYSAQGISPRRLQRRCAAGEMLRVRPGLYVSREAWLDLDRWDRYRLRILAVHVSAQHPPVFCHESAALIHGLSLLAVPPNVHVQQGAVRCARSRGDIRRHFTSSGVPPVVRVSGLRATTLDATLAALAVDCGFEQAVVALDHALRRRVTDPAALRARLWSRKS